VQAVSDYLNKTGITVSFIEDSITEIIANLTNNDQQVMNALNQLLPELIADIENLNETEIINYFVSLLENEMDSIPIDYNTIIQEIINVIVQNLTSTIDPELLKHLEVYLPELISKLSQV
jgi:uncharacterized protein Yka (UPF0111/DUF47 family)